MAQFCGCYNRRDAINGFPLVVVVDQSDVAAQDAGELSLDHLYAEQSGRRTSTASRRLWLDKHWGCFGSLVIDARSKPHHAPPLVEDRTVTQRVDGWRPAAVRCTG